MEETPEVYHYSLAEAAELLGCKESHVLQFAAFNDLPLHVFVTDTVVDNDGNWKGGFSNYFRLNSTHIRTLIANGSTKLDPIQLMEATPVQPLLGINYADHALSRVPLENGSWTYDRFPQTKEISLTTDRILILAEHLSRFQAKPSGGEECTPEVKQLTAGKKWWHEYKPLEMAQRIAKRMREENDLVLTGKDKGKISASRIYHEIADEITSTEKRRAIKRDEQARPISYKSVETYLKENGFNPNP